MNIISTAGIHLKLSFCDCYISSMATLSTFCGSMLILGYCTLLYMAESCTITHDKNGSSVNCFRQNLYHIPGNLPNDVTVLNLRDNHLIQVTADDVPYLQLRHLDLSFNDMTSLYPGTFLNLSKLEVLDLRYNKLDYSTWNNDVFIGLINLLDLRIGQCTGEDTDHKVVYPYPRGVFSRIPNLQNLSLGCVHGNLPQIPGEIASLKYLHSLSFGPGGLMNITNFSFRRMARLHVRTLRIATIRTEYIHRNAFIHLTSLTTLQITLPNVGLNYSLFSLKYTHIKCLILDLARIHSHVMILDTVCDGVGKSLEYLSLLGLRYSHMKLTTLRCFKTLRQFSVRYMNPILRIGHRYIRNFNDLTYFMNNLPSTYEVMEYSYIHGDTFEYSNQYTYCTRSNQRPCYLEISDYFLNGTALESETSKIGKTGTGSRMSEQNGRRRLNLGYVSFTH